jgi:hypothetical protein
VVVPALATEESMLILPVGASIAFRHREPVSPLEKHVVVWALERRKGSVEKAGGTREKNEGGIKAQAEEADAFVLT